jgi:hypothetical protein
MIRSNVSNIHINYKIKSIYTDGQKKLGTRIKKILSLFCHKTKRSQNSDLINSTINWTNINQRPFFLSCSSRTLFAPQHNMYFFPTVDHNSNLEWIVQLCYVLVRNISKWIRKTSHVSFIMEHVNKMTLPKPFQVGQGWSFQLYLHTRHAQKEPGEPNFISFAEYGLSQQYWLNLGY